MDTLLQNLAAAIEQIGSDDKERAELLGVSRRTITDYKAGKFPRVIRALMQRGILVMNSSKEGAIVAQERG